MDLSKFIYVSGISSLFKIIAQGKNGFIVESLADKKRMPVHVNSKVSVLKNISIYMNNGDTIPLADVLKKMYEKQSGQPAPDPKTFSDDGLKNFFTEVLPEYDREKVHTSDIRKLMLWYNMLLKTDVFIHKDAEQTESGDVPALEDKKEKSFSQHSHEGKHLNPNMSAPKKTIGVRKTGSS
jgi:hypothetical protein